MVKQYDVIMISLEPTKGHEKGKNRPCLVISNTEFTNMTKFAWILPITSRELRYPTDVALKTVDNVIRGVIDCTQIRALDLKARPHKIVDSLEENIINKIKDVLIKVID